MNIRIGQGYDVYQLIEGHDLIFDGVHILSEKGLLDHSDADALLYTLTDVLLGTAGLGDVGSHSSDTAAELKDADNHVLLREAYQGMRALGWHVVNVDATIIAQKPKLAPHIPAMRVNIAANLGIQTACVNIKGKTNEKLGCLGRMEAIEAQVVVLLQKADTP